MLAAQAAAKPETNDQGDSSLSFLRTARSPLGRPENIVHHTINSNKTRAPSASKRINHTMMFPLRIQRLQSLSASLTTRRGVQMLLIVGMLAACSSTPRQPPADVEDRAPVAPVSPPQPAHPGGTAPSADAPAAAPATTGSYAPNMPPRWIPAPWQDLPHWDRDKVLEFWPAFLQSCTRPTAAWTETCARARSVTPQNEDAVRMWLHQHLQPYRVEGRDGQASGLITGYFEPIIEASRQRRGALTVPLYSPPADLNSRRPYWTRQQLDTEAQAQASLRGREIAYVADPLDALSLQIQGSGRLQITEANGDTRLIRLAFAGHNNHPYQSVGRWLIDQGELPAGQASWPAIKNWAGRFPHRVNEMLWVNPRVVFFNEEPLPNPELGPRGAQGVPLTPGRSIAVDPRTMPYGTPVWLDTTEPLSDTPLRRLVVAQDTGSAIVGAVRADYFWGWGQHAHNQAGRMKQALRYWVLWPKTAPTVPWLAP